MGGGAALGLQMHHLHLLKSVSYSKARKRGEGKEQTRNRAGRGDRGESRSRRAGLEEREETGEPTSLPGPAGHHLGSPGLVPDLPTACPPRSSGPALHPMMSGESPSGG